MIKTEFIGRVNGKTFTTIEEYNTEVQRCILENIPFVASAESAYSNVPEVPEDEPTSEVPDNEPIIVPPAPPTEEYKDEYKAERGPEVADIEAFENAITTIINSLKGTDEDKQMIESLRCNLESNMELVRRAMMNYDIDGLIKFILALKGEADAVQRMLHQNTTAFLNAGYILDDTRERISDCKDEIEELEDDLKEIEKAKADTEYDLSKSKEVYNRELENEKIQIKNYRILDGAGSILHMIMKSYKDTTAQARAHLSNLQNKENEKLN